MFKEHGISCLLHVIRSVLLLKCNESYGNINKNNKFNLYGESYEKENIIIRLYEK